MVSVWPSFHAEPRLSHEAEEQLSEIQKLEAQRQRHLRLALQNEQEIERRIQENCVYYFFMSSILWTSCSLNCGHHVLACFGFRQCHNVEAGQALLSLW